MRYTLLSLGIVLLTSCQKDAPPPVPAFAGRWHGETSATLSYTALDGTYIGRTADYGPQLNLVVTADSLLFYDPRTNAKFANSESYARQGNTLTLGSRRSAFIDELADHRLVIRYPGHPANLPYLEYEYGFSR
ncbi:hypothetical protein [Hymenobacter antarcticus]|uniref:Lipocalin-like domain-containing protein n=1 Tax=Hymenobacter antarcticus TaxID=486270 RepID=A0ABP7QLE5_9BACT